MARRGGWRRQGSRGHFRYLDSRGRRITDETKLGRIEGLVIPPAWRDVWISPNASARLQATGTDKAGRRQYLYHPAFRAAQEEAKFERLVGFGERLPQLREHLAEHLDESPHSLEWTCALAVTLINRAWFRVGSDRYARSSRTYGVTTLSKRHVTVRGKKVTFTFQAKHRVAVRTTLVDDELADAVRALLQLHGGRRLFRFDRDGTLSNLTAPILNDYLAEYLGGGFTAKDFRPWGGTLTAAIALADHGPPTSVEDERRTLAAAMRKVGAELGNTAAVARTSYVSPAVIEQWRDGRTLSGFRKPRPRPISAHQVGLEPDEEALLSLLRSWRLRRARAAA